MRKVSNAELHADLFVKDSGLKSSSLTRFLPPEKAENPELALLENGSLDVEWGPNDSRILINVAAANIKYVRILKESK